MVFEILNAAAERGELLLFNGGLCHWHLRKDGQLTIREIIVLPYMQRQGIGSKMLKRLKTVSRATSIFAKCPADLPANGWYQHMGFEDEGVEETKGGRQLRKWRYQI